jgi:hypothetical protein
MRTSVLAIIIVAGGAIAFPATAQQNPGQQQPAVSEKMHPDAADTGVKGSGPSEQMQRDADKGAKTRNSGESGYVADQDKPGTSAHPPGQPLNDQTTGIANAPGK